MVNTTSDKLKNMVNTSRDKQRTWLIQVEINKNMVNTSRDQLRT